MECHLIEFPKCLFDILVTTSLEPVIESKTPVSIKYRLINNLEALILGG